MMQDMGRHHRGERKGVFIEQQSMNLRCACSFGTNLVSFHAKGAGIECERIVVRTILVEERVKVEILQNISVTHSTSSKVHWHCELQKIRAGSDLDKKS
jgi:hypothetical protein